MRGTHLLQEWMSRRARILFVLSMATCVLLQSACAATTVSNASSTSITEADDVAQIQTLYANWRTAVEAGDIPGYVGVLHPDVHMMPPGADAVVGSGSYANFLGPVFATATYKIEVTKAQQIEVLGDTAIAEYEYVIHLALKDPSQGITEPGALTANRTAARYFDVLRKKPDGSWGVWRHLWQDQ